MPETDAQTVPMDFSSPGRGDQRHPAGLAVLACTEMAERFSYYGMTALLALYMIKQLLKPQHATHVLGLGALRHVFEFRGPMSDAAFASLIYGWYGGLVYFTPILGGWVADRFLGARRTVVIGALLMACGHMLMSFDATFLIALTFLIVGSGCLKGNISEQVGALYGPDAESLRTRGFTIFSTAINIGSVAGPLATGAAAAAYGWHAGFAVSAALMLAALAVYLAGQAYLKDVARTHVRQATLPPLARDEKRRAAALVVLIALSIPANIAYTMIWNIGIIWIDQRVDLETPLGAVPAGWFNSVDSFASIVAAMPLVAFWAMQSRRGSEPGSLAKIGIGSGLVAISALLLGLVCLAPQPNGKIAVAWALAAYFGMGVAFMWFWPVTLAAVAQWAPPRLRSTLMGASFLSLFVGTTVMGWVGSFYDQMPNSTFWFMDSAIAGAGTLLVFVVRRPLTGVLERQALLEARVGRTGADFLRQTRASSDAPVRSSQPVGSLEPTGKGKKP